MIGLPCGKETMIRERNGQTEGQTYLISMPSMVNDKNGVCIGPIISEITAAISRRELQLQLDINTLQQLDNFSLKHTK